MAEINLDNAKRLDITCRRGNTFRLELNITDTSTGLPLDVTGWTFSAKILDSNDNEVLSFEDENFTKTVEGVLTMTRASAVMANITPGSYQYDLQAVRTSDGEVQTWVFGTFKVNADKT